MIALVWEKLCLTSNRSWGIKAIKTPKASFGHFDNFKKKGTSTSQKTDKAEEKWNPKPRIKPVIKGLIFLFRAITNKRPIKTIGKGLAAPVETCSQSGAVVMMTASKTPRYL